LKIVEGVIMGGDGGAGQLFLNVWKILDCGKVLVMSDQGGREEH